MDKINETLKKLGLSQSEIDVYKTLSTQGAMAAIELLKATHMKRPTLYYSIRQLEDRGLVHTVPSAGASRYQSERPEKLLTLLAMREEELRSIGREISEIIPSLREGVHHHEGVPTVTFYQGEENMKQAILDTLYCRSRHIDVLAPKDNFFWQIGQTFSQKYVNERVNRKITARHLWEEALPPSILKKSYQGLSTIRILPRQMHGKFRTAIFLFDERVMYISSRASGYVLIVTSKEHYEIMKTLYEMAWSMSKECTA